MNLDQVKERALHHFELADEQTRSAAFWATAFQWGIPILSAFVTAAASGELVVGEVNLKNYLVWFSLVLTIMTIANTVARPAEGFRIAAQYANKFWGFIAQLDIDIEEIKLQTVDSEEQKRLANAYASKKIEELAKLVEGFNAGFLPAQPSQER